MKRSTQLFTLSYFSWYPLLLRRMPNNNLRLVFNSLLKVRMVSALLLVTINMHRDNPFYLDNAPTETARSVDTYILWCCKTAGFESYLHTPITPSV